MFPCPLGFCHAPAPSRAPTARLNDPSSVGANPSEFPLFLGGIATSCTRVNRVFFLSGVYSYHPPSNGNQKINRTYDPIPGCISRFWMQRVVNRRVIPFDTHVSDPTAYVTIPVSSGSENFNLPSNNTHTFYKVRFLVTPRTYEKGVPGNLEPQRGGTNLQKKFHSTRSTTKQKKLMKGLPSSLVGLSIASGFALSPRSQRKLDVYFLFIYQSKCQNSRRTVRTRVSSPSLYLRFQVNLHHVFQLRATRTPSHVSTLP